MSAAAELPVAVAVRRMGKGNTPVWVVRKCPICRQGHGHAADPVMSEVIVTAPCDRTRFYRLVLKELESAADHTAGR